MGKTVAEMQSTSLNSLEERCLARLHAALHKYFVESKIFDSTVIFSHFKEVFLKPSSESSNGRCLNNNGADDSFKVKNAVQYLKDINGVFFVLDSATGTCVVARSFSTLSETKLIQQSVSKFIHEDDQFHFDLRDRLSDVKDTNDVSSKQLSCFDCRFRMERGGAGSHLTENCDPFYSFNMSCMRFAERLDDQRLTDKKTEGSLLIMCVASQAKNIRPAPPDQVPPNQTISTRGKIPKPVQFCTVQDINGDVMNVCMSLNDLKQSNKTTIPARMKDDIRSSLESFLSPSNGLSLSKFLLKQVLNYGKGSCRSSKFQLKDGNLATLLTKSELVSQTSRIISTHYIYREATLKDFDVKGLPKSLLSSIPVPPLTQLSASSESPVTMTTSSIATTSSLSSDDFLTSSHYVNQSIKNESYLADAPQPYNMWQREARNSLDVTKDFLSGITKTEPSFELNGVVSPPPHLDGHLVHSIGGQKSSSDHLLQSTPNNFLSSRTSSVNSTVLPSLPADIANVGDFLPQPEPDLSLYNHGTYSGPPCVDLGSCDMTPKSDIAPTSSSLLFIDSLKKEAPAPTAKPLVPAPNSSSMSSPSVPSLPNTSFSHPRECVTPDKGGSSTQISVPKRPRSASINTSNASNSALKRSSSTLSEDSGIGDLPHGNKSSPHRLRARDKSKKCKILSELLTKDNPDDVSISFTANSSAPRSTGAHSSASKTMTPSSTQGIFSTISSSLSKTSSFTNPLSKNSAPQSSAMPIPVSTVSSVSIPKTSHLGTISSNFLGNMAGTSQQPNDLLPENLDMDEIFDCYESIIGNPSSSQPQQPLPKLSGPLRPFLSNTSNNILPASQNSMMTQQRAPEPTATPMNNPNHQPNIILSPVNSTPLHNVLSSPQSMPPNPVVSPQQALPRPSSGNNLSFQRIVPTDQETCPNRIVGSNVMISPKPPLRAPPAAQYGNDYGVAENWAGEEPLVDLGAIPPPSGINPRMAIRSQLHMNRPTGIPPSNTMQSSLSPRMARNPPVRMQMNMQSNHQQNLNSAIPPTVSPSSFPNSASPNTFPHIRVPASSLNSTPRPGYNNMQHQRVVAGNIRNRILRQQGRPNPPPPYQSDAPLVGGAPQYNINNKQEMSRYVMTQRHNGAMLRQQKSVQLSQRSNPSPVAQAPFNQMNNISNNRFPSNQSGVGQFSPMGPQQQQNSFHNQTFNNDHLSSSINFDHGMRPQVIMGPQSSNQFNSAPSDSFNAMGNTMGPRMGNSFSLESLNSAPNVVPVGKPTLKRSRSKKGTRKKNSTDEGAWVTDDVNNAYKQRNIMQMTIGNMHQRPQPIYNSPLDGTLQTNNSVLSPQGGSSMQTLNLNSLMNQSMNKVGFDPPINSFRSLPNAVPLQGNPPGNPGWSDPNMTSAVFDDIFDGDMSRTSGYSLDGIATAESHATMNSNVNNNNKADVAPHVRYTATAAMVPSASSGPLCSPEKGEKKKKHVLLESLLLKND